MPKELGAPQWAGRAIMNDGHRHDLESKAALYEFKHRMSKEDAEHRAYHEYKQNQLVESAAHHLAGIKAASAEANQEEGRKHGVMFALAMKALGHDANGPVPEAIKARMQKQDKFYKFKPHKADSFLLQDEKKEPMAKAVPPANANQVDSKIVDIAGKRQEKQAATKTKNSAVLADVFQTMASDPGFQQAARQRDVEMKAAKLKQGGPKFQVGQPVLHVNQDSIPWVGKVHSMNYEDHGIDGPGHYAEVRWWNPKAKQYHESLEHQDSLLPHKS